MIGDEDMIVDERGNEIEMSKIGELDKYEAKCRNCYKVPNKK